MAKTPKEPTSLQRARKAHAKRLREQGCKPKTFWANPGAQAAFEKLANTYLDASASDIINAALIARADQLDRRDAVVAAAKAAQTPAQPVSSPKPTKTTEKTVKAVREAPAQTAGQPETERAMKAILDLPLGPIRPKPGDLAKKGTRK